MLTPCTQTAGLSPLHSTREPTNSNANPLETDIADRIHQCRSAAQVEGSRHSFRQRHEERIKSLVDGLAVNTLCRSVLESALHDGVLDLRALPTSILDKLPADLWNEWRALALSQGHGMQVRTTDRRRGFRHATPVTLHQTDKPPLRSLSLTAASSHFARASHRPPCVAPTETRVAPATLSILKAVIVANDWAEKVLYRGIANLRGRRSMPDHQLGERILAASTREVRAIFESYTNKRDLTILNQVCPINAKFGFGNCGELNRLVFLKLAALLEEGKIPADVIILHGHIAYDDSHVFNILAPLEAMQRGCVEDIVIADAWKETPIPQVLAGLPEEWGKFVDNFSGWSESTGHHSEFSAFFVYKKECRDTFSALSLVNRIDQMSESERFSDGEAANLPDRQDNEPYRYYDAPTDLPLFSSQLAPPIFTDGSERLTTDKFDLNSYFCRKFSKHVDGKIGHKEDFSTALHHLLSGNADPLIRCLDAYEFPADSMAYHAIGLIRLGIEGATEQLTALACLLNHCINSGITRKAVWYLHLAEELLEKIDENKIESFPGADLFSFETHCPQTCRLEAHDFLKTTESFKVMASLAGLGWKIKRCTRLSPENLSPSVRDELRLLMFRMISRNNIDGLDLFEAIIGTTGILEADENIVLVAARLKSWEFALSALDNSVDVNMPHEGGSIFALAITQRETHAVRQLLSRADIDPNREQLSGRRPLEIAISKNAVDIAKMLFERNDIFLTPAITKAAAGLGLQPQRN